MHCTRQTIVVFYFVRIKIHIASWVKHCIQSHQDDCNLHHRVRDQASKRSRYGSGKLWHVDHLTYTEATVAPVQSWNSFAIFDIESTGVFQNYIFDYFRLFRKPDGEKSYDKTNCSADGPAESDSWILMSIKRMFKLQLLSAVISRYYRKTTCL